MTPADRLTKIVGADNATLISNPNVARLFYDKTTYRRDFASSLDGGGSSMFPATAGSRGHSVAPNVTLRPESRGPDGQCMCEL